MTGPGSCAHENFQCTWYRLNARDHFKCSPLLSPWPAPRNTCGQKTAKRKGGVISTCKTYWRLQPTAAGRSGIFSEIHGALCTQDVSFNNACMRTVCKWLRRNNGLTLSLNPVRYYVWRAMHKTFMKASPKAKYWITRCTGETWGNILQNEICPQL